MESTANHFNIEGREDHPTPLELPTLPKGLTFDFSEIDGPISFKQKVLAVAGELKHPFYFYDLDQLAHHMNQLQTLSKDVVKLWYACKANPLSDILHTMDNCGLKFDIASPGELAQVLRQKISPQNILATGPAKSKELIGRYLDAGVKVFVLEGHNQVKWLNEQAAKRKIFVRALLRLQIDWASEENSVLGGNEITPFGLQATEWEKLDLQEYPHIDFFGIHTFQWGNILNERRMIEIWAIAIEKCHQLAKKMAIPLNVVDLGGGIGIPYHRQKKQMDFKYLVKSLAALKKQYCIEEIWLELGRFAVGPYGGYVTKVVDKKNVRGQDILVLDSGMNQIARPSLTKQGFPIESLRQSIAPPKNYQIHGPLCTALDTLGIYSLPSDIDIDDWLYFKNCGAYGFTESMPYFLCHSLPGEAILSDKVLKMVRMPRPAEHYLV